MNELWVHYFSESLDLDSRIRAVVEPSGGKSFIRGPSSVEGRDISFKFNNAKDFENAVGGLAGEFDLEFMHTTGDEGRYSCHYRVR